MSTAAVISKADRLRSEGRVHRVSDTAWLVRGDHGTYAVAVRDNRTIDCDCPAWQADCSHRLAVQGELRAERDAGADPFDLLDTSPASADEVFAAMRGEGR